jgi:predicted AAA+ superfamily ATPase
LVNPVIANALKDYLRRGGFPLMWETLDLERGYDQLRRDVIERALFRDIPLMYPLRDIAALERLFYVCAPETGRIVSVEKLAGDIRRSQQTVDTHLKLIEETGLLLILKPYPGLSRRGLGGLPKLILADPALYHAAMRPLSLTLKPETEGQLLESIVAEHCASAARVLGGMLSYWRKGPLEVDLVLEIGGEAIPIGITKSARFERRNAEPLAAFLRAFPKKSSTALFLYTGEERDIPLREAHGMIACRHVAGYLAHLSQTSIPRPPV